MINVIFRARMKQGKEDEAVARMQKMADAVQGAEPDTSVYLVHRLQDDPGMLIIFESYKDDAAFKGHMGTSHMEEMRNAFGELFEASEVKLERLEPVGGFSRG